MRQILCSILFILISSNARARSIHRPRDPKMPALVASWQDGSSAFHIRDRHLFASTLFETFNKEYLSTHLLPTTALSYRYEQKKSVSGKKIQAIINDFVEELLTKKKKRAFAEVEILKDIDFDYTTAVGLIVVKLKKYPFVVKISIETPQSLVNPIAKGIGQYAIWKMSGGGGRHINGLTRIKNLHVLKKRLQEHDHWKELFDAPRKWFFLPQQNRWITLRGKNIGKKNEYCIDIPSVYAIVCDEIKGEQLSFFNKNDRETILAFARYQENRVDPYLKNYLREKSGKIVMIDTEHFPTGVGIRKQQNLHSYTRWYGTLALKFFKDLFGRSKTWHRQIQQEETPSILQI